MALANIGYLLATQMGKRVLCVDWDLEAPGLEKYFSGIPEVRVENAAKGGLIDLRGCVEAAQLAHELERGRADLVIGRRRIEIEQGLDAAAHDLAPRPPIRDNPCSSRQQ